MAARSPFFSSSSSSFLDQFQHHLGSRNLNQQQQQRQREAIERRRNFTDLVPYWFDEFQDFYHSDSELSADDAIHLPPHFSVEIDTDDYSDASDLFDNEVDSAGSVLDQVDFVRNLFEDRVEQQERERERMSRSGFGVVDDVDDSNYLDLGLDLGLGLNFGDENGDLLAREVEEEDDDDDLFLGSWRIDGGESMRMFGSRLRSEEVHRDHDVSDLCSEEENEFHLEFGNTLDDSIDDGSEGLCWNSLQLEDQSQTEADEELDWEEVADVDEVLDREVLSAGRAAFGIETDEVVESVLQQQNHDIVPDRIVTGWEVLLNAENVSDRNIELGNQELYFGPEEGYLYTDEYETVFGQFSDTDSGVIGKPPASKSSVENLATVLVTQADAETESKASLCAVCKDDIHVGEKAKKLPCSHSYHGDCIIPWLAIRNTCPICRFELPTDDPAYERRRTRRESMGN